MLRELNNQVEKLQEVALNELIKNTNVTSEEEEIVYLIALDKLEAKEDFNKWNKVYYEYESNSYIKNNNNWLIVDEDNKVILTITENDIKKYNQYIDHQNVICGRMLNNEKTNLQNRR